MTQQATIPTGHQDPAESIGRTKLDIHYDSTDREIHITESFGKVENRHSAHIEDLDLEPRDLFLIHKDRDYREDWIENTYMKSMEYTADFSLEPIED